MHFISGIFSLELKGSHNRNFLFWEIMIDGIGCCNTCKARNAQIPLHNPI